MSSSEKSSPTTVPVLLDLMAASEYDNRQVVKHYGNLSMKSALSSKSRSIGAISKDDEDKATKCITNLFRATSMYFDSQLSQTNAEVIATEILSKYEYRSLKLEDLVVICIRIKESDIFKLTPAKIMREIKKYWDERVKAAIEMNRQPSGFDQQLGERMLKHYRSTVSKPSIAKIASKRGQTNKKYK
ncbi:hypothetical protein [Pseudotenacibaculum haliotis]|uniref:Uncharacterized protein n=1 Tax=Pseudotenacibaculum haliotis TaxID=1862138 RepID=A0ABW5LQ59_9FLAO